MIGQQAPPLGPEDFNGAENRALLAALQDAPSIVEEATPEDRLAELPEPLCGARPGHPGRSAAQAAAHR